LELALRLPGFLLCPGGPHRDGAIRHYMSREVQAVSVDDTLLDVATRFVDTKHRRFPVMEDNRVVGLVTRRDVLKAVLDSAS
jgi:CBS domain-containing protein